MAYSKLFTSLMWIGICINIVAYLYQYFSIGPAILPTVDLSSLSGWFSLGNDAPIVLVFSGGTIAIGIVGLLLRGGSFPVYAMIIAGLCVIIAPVRYFVSAIPNLIGSLIPAPYAAPFIIAMGTVIAFSGFMFIFSIITSRGDL